MPNYEVTNGSAAWNGLYVYVSGSIWQKDATHFLFEGSGFWLLDSDTDAPYNAYDYADASGHPTPDTASWQIIPVTVTEAAGGGTTQYGNLAADTLAAFEGQGYGIFIGIISCDTVAGFDSSGADYNANDRGANLTADTWEDIDATTAQVGTADAENMGYFIRFPVTAGWETVTSAILTLEAALSQSGSSALRITLLDYDDCGQFTDANFAAPSNVSLSATYLAWNPDAWTADNRYEVDVATLVQAFIDRAGYASGQHIGLLIAGGE